MGTIDHTNIYLSDFLTFYFIARDLCFFFYDLVVNGGIEFIVNMGNVFAVFVVQFYQVSVLLTGITFPALFFDRAYIKELPVFQVVIILSLYVGIAQNEQ